MRRFVTMAIAAMTAMALAAPAGAGPAVTPNGPAPIFQTPDQWVNETPNAWFVQLSSPPKVKGTTAAKLASERQAFKSAASTAGIDYTIRGEFDTLFNGLSITVDSSQLGRLAQIPNVAALYPVLSVPLPETDLAGPQLATAIQMTGADIVQSELGYTGAGVKVAVMDTGIDYDHPDLGGCFGAGCRVAYGWDFVGDAYNADPASATYDPIPVPDADPDDCQGHGTHVSGIIGANGGAVGVAPGVTFGAYRVFGCDGSTEADIMISAMEMALADHMDVLNMSIGSGFTWPQYPTAVAADYLVDQGMVVVASIGNDGASGTFSAGAPGLGDKVIGVAAFENLTATFPVFEVNATQIGFNPMEFSDDPPTSGTEEIVYVGRGCDADLPLLDDPSGKVALIDRGACSFAEKAENGYDAGATAVIVANNASGNFNGTLGAPPVSPEIVVSISKEDGDFIKAQTAPVSLTWTSDVAAFPNPAAGLIASFSAYGLAPDLTLKPDIGAPGGNIYSTYPLEKGGYANLSGTSMSSPHVAGAAALFLEAHPGYPASQMRDVLQNSADPVDWFGAPGSGLMEPVHRQGAGMLDIDDAILQESLVTPGKLSLGESESGDAKTRTLRIHNDSGAPMTYTLGQESAFGCCSAAIATTGTMADELDYWLSGETVEYSDDEVTVPAGGYADVDVTITPETPDGAFDHVQYGGWLTVMPDDGSDVLRVPYAGFIGDYQELQVLTPSAYGVFPALGVTDDGSSFGLVFGDGWVYTMEGFDVPNVLLHLHQQPRMIIAEIHKGDGSLVQSVFNTGFVEEYLPRNSTNAGFFAFPWDGTRIHSDDNPRPVAVPDGEYYIVIKVLKALGDVNNPAHWETWTSPVFVIDRPDVKPGKKPKK